MWGIYMAFEGTDRPWGWGISQDLLYTFIEVGERGGDWTCVYTSFLTVISSRGYWCRSLDVDGPRFVVLFRHLVLKGKFPNCFSFYFII